MTEKLSIASLFKDLFDGEPWLEINLYDTLKNVSSDSAVKKLGPVPNSIWELVNHIIEWRLNVLQRVQGKFLQTPADNYLRGIKDTSPAAWKLTLDRLNETQDMWIDFLQKMNNDTLANVYPVNGMSYFQHIHGIIQHDAYHLGQIVLLAKYAA